MHALRYAVIGLALAAIMWPFAPPKARGGLAGSEWRVVEIAGEKAVGAGALRFTQTSVRGKAACNSFFGAFRENHDNIEIAGINTTRMLCSGRMELEQALLGSLARVKSYRIDGNTVLLLDADGRAVARLAT